jgi:hypothetical protein
LESNEFDFIANELKLSNNEYPIELLNIIKNVLVKLKNSNYEVNLSLDSNLAQLIDSYNSDDSYLYKSGALNNSVVSKLKQIISKSGNQL